MRKRVAGRKGNRRQTIVRDSTIGWSSRERTKVSPMHAKGYAYEVRFQGSWFDFQQTPVRGGFRIIRGRVIRDFPKRDKLVADLRRMFSNKIVSSHTRYLPDLRIYLRSEAELVQLRMITNAEVFRVYRLLPPAEADGSISKNDAIVSESQA